MIVIDDCSTPKFKKEKDSDESGQSTSNSSKEVKQKRINWWESKEN